jgi:hypothetical protein
MLKIIAAVLFAALVGGVTTFAPRVSEATEPSGPQRSLKGDRLPIRVPVPACAQSAWPYHDAKCMHDRTQPATRARETRVAMIDRVPAMRLAATD